MTETLRTLLGAVEKGPTARTITASATLSVPRIPALPDIKRVDRLAGCDGGAPLGAMQLRLWSQLALASAKTAGHRVDRHSTPRRKKTMTPNGIRRAPQKVETAEHSRHCSPLFRRARSSKLARHASFDPGDFDAERLISQKGHAPGRPAPTPPWQLSASGLSMCSARADFIQ